ncbi:unnamed protein product, partial [Brassica rapa subsp. narinosa]
SDPPQPPGGLASAEEALLPLSLLYHGVSSFPLLSLRRPLFVALMVSVMQFLVFF